MRSVFAPITVAFLALAACAPAAQPPSTAEGRSAAAKPVASAPLPAPSPDAPMPKLSTAPRFADLKADADGKVRLPDAEWKKRLTQLQYAVTRHAATEAPGTGEFEDTETAGNYFCVCCGQLLYGSQHKFHSGCGWPAFMDEVNPGSIAYHEDRSHGMVRTEITCTRCDAHLGHAFHGERLSKTNVRHCVNSASLFFEAGTPFAKQDAKGVAKEDAK